MVTITIDGKQITSEDSKTILEVARENRIRIPTLCYHPRLIPIGSCRLCVVEVEGSEKPMSACTTVVQDGIVVHTQTDRLDRIRRDALKLILLNHPLDCPQCDAAGACELQNLVFEFGIDQQDYRATRTVRGMKEFATPLIRQWGDRCVMCLRCIRADHEIVRARAIDLVGKGYEAEVGVRDHKACISCGECLRVCPVGALTEGVSRIKARPWQRDKVLTTCNFCSQGCQLELNVFENKVIGVTSPEDKGGNKGSLCQRGAFGYEFLHHSQRITRPMVKRAGQWEEVSWEEALSFVASMINAVVLSSGPQRVGGLISPRCTNEEAYLFQRFMREVVGTSHIDTTGRLCHEPYRLALQEVLGRQYLSATLDDVADSDCVVVLGGDLDRDNHIIAAHRVREALWRRGARLIVAHPRKVTLADEADCWFALRPGDEIAWANGLIHLLVEKGKEAWGPAVERIEGFDALKKTCRRYTPEHVEELTGVSAQLLREAAGYLAEAKKPAVICSPPLGQQVQGVDQCTAVVNLALVCNALPSGGGLHFIGPQSNMVGVAEMGAVPGFLPGYRPTDVKGFSTIEMFQAASEGRLKTLFVVGENPLIVLPRFLVEAGLKALELLVVQDMFLSETAEQAHVFLPALSFAEKDGTYTNCEGRIQRLRKALEPPEGLKWTGEVLSDVTSFMGKEMKALPVAEVFREITGVNPLYKGMTFEPGDTQWRDGTGGDLLGKAAFRPVEPARTKGNDAYPMRLSVEGLFYNHLIGSGYQKRAHGLARVGADPYLEMNAEEAAEMGIADGSRVRVTTPWGEVTVEARRSATMKRGVISLWCSLYGVDAARLVGEQVDPHAQVPAYGGVPARVDKG